MKHRLFGVLFFIIISGVIFLSLPTIGAVETTDDEVAGTVTKLRAHAVAVQDALPRALVVGSPVYVHDVISTGTDARITIRMIDDGVLTLGERTVFVVIDYVFKGTQGNAVLRLLSGAVRAVTGGIGKLDDRPFMVLSEIATVGIRGTDFFVGFIHDELHVGLLGGAGVYVENPAGRVEITKIGDGTKVTRRGIAPTKPAPWPKSMLEMTSEAVSFE